MKTKEETRILHNLSVIEKLRDEKNKLRDEIRAEPLLVVSGMFKQLKVESIESKEDKLLKENEKLWSKVEKNTTTPPITIDKQIPKQSQGGKGWAVPLPKELLTKWELLDLEKQLESVYAKKDEIYMQIQNTPDLKATPEQNAELDKLIREEAKLTTQSQDLRNDVEFYSVSERNFLDKNETSMQMDNNKKTLREMDELSDLREQNSKRDIDMDYMG